MSKKQVCGRFAPTPSGRMHLGNVFCAMLAWLSVRSQNGKMILRIEDLDPARCKREYAETLIEDMLWLGFDWDEGGLNEGYVQSRRSDIYASYTEKLNALGLTYPCYCSREELHAANAPHASDGTYIYPGTCRYLTVADRAVKSRKPALRLISPDKEITFTDGHLGTYTENLASDCGDFIIQRSDGVYAYQLAVVVDDALMGINEVVRGVDLLPSTARQMYLFDLLGFERPSYIHVPLLVAADGRRLSKRDRDLDIGVLRGNGKCPEEIIGHLAFHSGIISREEPVKLLELIPYFSWEKVKKENILIK